jgi:hypothetical protein
MAIKYKDPSVYVRPVIDLDGPDGNAFVLLAYARKFAHDLDLNYGEIELQMISGDYENLVNVFDAAFGKYVDLIRSK